MNTTTRAKRIFVSCHNRDRRFLPSALKLLSRRGLVDPKTVEILNKQVTDVSVASDLRRRVMNLMKSADLVVVFWSQLAQEAPWTNYEVGLAGALNVPVLVVDLQAPGLKLPEGLRPRLRVRLRSPSPARSAAPTRKGGAGTGLLISKARIKSASKKCNVSGDFYGALDKKVRKLIAAAEAHAVRNKRKTLTPQDL